MKRKQTPITAYSQTQLIYISIAFLIVGALFLEKLKDITDFIPILVPVLVNHLAFSFNGYTLKPKQKRFKVMGLISLTMIPIAIFMIYKSSGQKIMAMEEVPHYIMYRNIIISAIITPVLTFNYLALLKIINNRKKKNNSVGANKKNQS